MFNTFRLTQLPGKMIMVEGVVFAGTLKDHHFNSRFKAFIDRGYFTAQVPVMNKKYIAYLVSGPLRQRPLAKQFLDIFAGNRFMINVGYVSDEYTDDHYLSQLIFNHAKNFDNHIQNKIPKPYNFFSNTYHLKMRETLSILTSIKTAAYKYYTKNKLMDFPHRSLKKRILGFAYNIAFNMPVVKMKMRKNLIKIHKGFFSKLFKE